jgi:hypothetical protein
MNAMTVFAQREQMLLRSGQTIVEPRALAAFTGSIADLLRAVPGVEIDAEGKVRIRGNAGALVLINGRRSALSGDALIAYLRQMPAHTLERVEVATTTSASQDANAAAGVLNLVFRDADDAEHSTPLRSASARLASADEYMVSAAATGHAGRLVHWNAAYSGSASRPHTNADIARWTVLPGDLPFTTTEKLRAVSAHRMHSLTSGAALTPTPATAFGLRGTYSWMQGATATRRSAAYEDEAGNTAASTTASAVEHLMPAGEVVGSARVERGRLRFTSEIRTSVLRAEYRGNYDDVAGGYQYLRAAMHARQDELLLRNALQLRWAGVDVDIGSESRTGRARARHNARHFSTLDSREFRHRSSVDAVYISAERRSGVFRGEAGFRVEEERSAAALDSRWTARARRVFPSLSGEWMDATRGLVYRAAYGRRLTRASWEMLSPLGMGDDGFGAVVGNAALRAEVVDQLEVGLERRGSQTVVQLTPFLRWSRDPVREAVTPTAQGVVRMPVNHLWARSVGVDVGWRRHPSDRLALTLTGTVANVETVSAAQRSVGVDATLRAVMDVRLARQTSAQLLVFGQSRQSVEQRESLPEANAQLALIRSAAGGRGQITLQVHGPWRTQRQQMRIPGTFAGRVHQFNRQPLIGIYASLAVGGIAL